MSRRLPPLNSLKAFEAAARHLSFTRAAEELFVTQAAVNHQIKALEECLGLKLFRRRKLLFVAYRGRGKVTFSTLKIFLRYSLRLPIKCSNAVKKGL